MGTKVRILVAVTLDGVTYRPDQVVDMPAGAAKALAAEGQVDPHRDAVAYCIRELKAEVITHVDPAEAKSAALAALQARIEAAAPADKPALEAELATLTAA